MSQLVELPIVLEGPRHRTFGKALVDLQEINYAAMTTYDKAYCQVQLKGNTNYIYLAMTYEEFKTLLITQQIQGMIISHNQGANP
jgi:hypothetical protein